MLTKTEAEQIFDFDYATGTARWKRIGGGVTRGSVAGNSNRRYVWIKLNGKYISGHKLAWLMYYGEPAPGNIDHINGNTFDNRKENLRLATQKQNCRNKAVRKDNLTGLKGVQLRPDGQWRARICFEGRSVHLGYFDTPDAAHSAYQRAARRYFGEFARTP